MTKRQSTAQGKMTDMNSGDVPLQINFTGTKLNTKKKKKVHSNQP